MNKTTLSLLLASLSLFGALYAPAEPVPAASTSATTAPKKTSLVVLPFVGKTEAEKNLAAAARKAVSAKMSRDGGYERRDNVEVDQMISALQVIWDESTGNLPDADEMQKVIDQLGAQMTITGQVQGQKLTLYRYDSGKLAKTASVEVPDLKGKESPKLAWEQVITELTGMQFAHIREVECDHSDPVVEQRFAQRPNLVADPSFEEASRNATKTTPAWGVLLGPKRWPPALLTVAEAEKMGLDQVAIVPQKMLPSSPATPGHCLLMRMSKHTAENNGLACESTWIPVEHGAKYRFTIKYHSTGPIPRLFIKGFAVKPDQYGSKEDPETIRREFYRAQINPRRPNDTMELIEMDFTPSVIVEGKGEGGSQARGMKIEWIRIDLYIYLKAGDVYFDDAVIKKISP